MSETTGTDIIRNFIEVFGEEESEKLRRALVGDYLFFDNTIENKRAITQIETRAFEEYRAQHPDDNRKGKMIRSTDDFKKLLNRFENEYIASVSSTEPISAENALDSLHKRIPSNPYYGNKQDISRSWKVIRALSTPLLNDDLDIASIALEEYQAFLSNVSERAKAGDYEYYFPDFDITDYIDEYDEDDYNDDYSFEDYLQDLENEVKEYTPIKTMSDLVSRCEALIDDLPDFVPSAVLENRIEELLLSERKRETAALTELSEYLYTDTPTTIFIHKFKDEEKEAFLEQVSFDDIMQAFTANRDYAAIVENFTVMQTALEKGIPASPIDVYPLARNMERSFVVHVGPTNSGKTHDAMQSLAKAKSGAYLGPLRLLAFEQYEKLNEMGCPCSLVTGEEERKQDNATHVSSTIEMLDFDAVYECCVIDEAQMMIDEDRGYRWTEAIIGAAASEIHVCVAPEGLEMVIRLIKTCGDKYRIVQHNRMTPLEPDMRNFFFPRSVEKGDALIVFSRAAVHAIAAVLSDRGYKVSMIYGALPYDVRHNEAERFASGETDVVVATDAIGMGMNLPIKRVVFLEQAKFDGHSRRFLLSSEVKQIAGRAGRYGIYDKGSYTSEEQAKAIRKLYNDKVDPIKQAPIGFGRSLVNVPGALSEILSLWAEMPLSEPFERQSMRRERQLVRELERRVTHGQITDNSVKHLIYKFATMPFKDNDFHLSYIWTEMFDREQAGKRYVFSINTGEPPANMETLEKEYSELDLLFQYCRVFGYSQHYEPIMKRRDEISKKMISLLGENNIFSARRCRECGRKMPWNWPYPMCDPCHDRLYSSRYDNYWY